jgi:hypothetical protein
MMKRNTKFEGSSYIIILLVPWNTGIDEEERTGAMNDEEEHKGSVLAVQSNTRNNEEEYQI